MQGSELQLHITEEYLVNEVHGIYANLFVLESKCIECDKLQPQSPNKSDKQWQALVSLHQALIHKHHDFFLASQHPSASPVLKSLAEKHAMPVRMWSHGIHSFLELLRHQKRDSLEYIFRFFDFAYSMMTLFLEEVPAFQKIWIECLGDLARYRMAIEVDMQNREAWASMARNWYHQAADKSQSVGRIQHHLAVLARPDMLQQLFYYTKSLISEHPFPSAGESVKFLFDPLLNAPKPPNQPIVASAFVAAHGYLFMQISSPSELDISGLDTQAREFLQYLDIFIGQMSTAFSLLGAYMSLSNFAAIFQYGATDAVIPGEFEKSMGSPQLPEVYHAASKEWIPVDKVDAIKAEFVKNQAQPSSQLIFYGSFFTFQTLSSILNHVGDRNVYSVVHTSLAFIWCMALNHTSIKHIEVAVPWRKLTTFLNTLVSSKTDLQLVESDDFPIIEMKKHMPEDFLIRGQLWGQKYYPRGFFDNAPTEDDGRSIESPSLNITRTYRCLWLGAKIAKVCLSLQLRKRKRC